MDTNKLLRENGKLILKEIRNQKLGERAVNVMKAITKDLKKEHIVYGGATVYGTSFYYELVRENWEWLKPILNKLEVSNG